MASGVYNIWKAESCRSTGPQWDQAAFTFRAMLVNSTVYTFDPDQNVVDDGTTADLRSAESTGTGYIGGYQSTDRQDLATPTITVDDTDNQAVFDTSNITYTAVNLGAGIEQGLAVVVEVGTSDTTSLPVCYFDSTTLSNSTTPVTTNGGDLNVTWSTAGVIQSS